MTIYYWIIAQHSGKVLEVEGGSVDNNAKIGQYSEKSKDDPNVKFFFCIKYYNKIMCDYSLLIHVFFPLYLRLMLNSG